MENNRNRNTRRDGGSFSEATIQAVWEKGARIFGNDNPDLWRVDKCGARIFRHDYGKTISTGWEIDHIDPVANGGGDELSNLQPLHWENNRHKGDDYPNWTCLKKG
jgi:hypothetical protein